jgi:hypothetical protein
MSALSSDQSVWIVAGEAAGSYGTNAVQTAFDADDNLTLLEVLSGSQITPAPAPVRLARQRAGAAGTKNTHIENVSNATINCAVRGGIGANFVPVLDPLFRACGLTQFSSTGGVTVYKAVGTNAYSASIVRYLRAITGTGIEHRMQSLAGFVGTAVFTFTAGQFAQVAFTMTAPGHAEWGTQAAYWSATVPILDTDSDALVYTGTISQDNGEDLICKAMGVTVGSETYPCSAVTISLNWSVNPSGDVHADPPVARIMRTRGDDSNIGGNIALSMVGTVEADYADAFDDVLTKYQASTEAAIAIVLTGATSQVTFAMPKIQFARPAERADNNVMAWDLGYTANGDYGSAIFGDNDLTITYEAV